MAKKRGQNDGCIYKTKTGWRVALRVGGGRRIYRRAKSRADARAILLQLQNRPPAASVGTVGAYLDRWLDVAAGDLSENTVSQYRRLVRVHLRPKLGQTKLTALTGLQVSEALQSIPGDRTKQYAYAVLRRALAQAVLWDLIPGNPCDRVDRPKNQRKAIDPFSAEDVKVILSAAEGDRYEALYWVAFGLGLRQEELFGLRIRDWDRKAQTLSVRQVAVEIAGKVHLTPPKTDRSRRVIDLPKATNGRILDAVGTALPHLEKPLFPAPRGGWIHRTTFRVREWLPLLVAAGVRSRGMHHTRHTYATLALSAGQPVHAVAAVLGHARTSTTLDTYAHAVAQMRSDAVQAVHDLIA